MDKENMIFINTVWYYPALKEILSVTMYDEKYGQRLNLKTDHSKGHIAILTPQSLALSTVSHRPSDSLKQPCKFCLVSMFSCSSCLSAFTGFKMLSFCGHFDFGKGPDATQGQNRWVRGRGHRLPWAWFLWDGTGQQCSFCLLIYAYRDVKEDFPNPLASLKNDKCIQSRSEYFEGWAHGNTFFIVFFRKVNIHCIYGSHLVCLLFSIAIKKTRENLWVKQTH